jgi:uncharacterized protein
VAQRFATEFGFALDTALVPPVPVERAQRSRGGGGINPFWFFIAIWIILAIINSRSRRGRRGRGGCGSGIPIIIPMGGGRGGWGSGGGSWGGGGFGGGGGGFGGFGGGGGFSGGGGGSSW